MAEGKSSFILYCDQRGVWDKLNDEQAGKLIKHIFKYVTDENPVPEDFITEIAFEPIKASLKRDLKKYESTLEERSVSGQMGNLKRWHKDLYDKVQKDKMELSEALFIAKSRKSSHSDTSVSHPIAKIAVNDSVSVTVSDNDTVSDIKQKEVRPSKIPTIEDFISYGLKKAEENNMVVSETAIRMKYEAWKTNGWKNGNDKQIKNWKSSLLNTLKFIQETEKGNPKVFETQKEKEAREFMEQLKKDAQDEILYGEQPNQDPKKLN